MNASQGSKGFHDEGGLLWREERFVVAAREVAASSLALLWGVNRVRKSLDTHELGWRCANWKGVGLEQRSHVFRLFLQSSALMIHIEGGEGGGCSHSESRRGTSNDSQPSHDEVSITHSGRRCTILWSHVGVLKK